MKKTILASLLILVFSGCSASRVKIIKCNSDYAFSSYNLADEGNRNQALITLLNKNKHIVDISKNPMVVIDAIPYAFCESARQDHLNIESSEIFDVSLLGGESAVEFYGKQAINGIILITSKEFEEKHPSKKN